MLAHRLGLVLVCCVALGACQGARVENATRHHALVQSEVVYVERFDTSRTEWIGDQGEHQADEVAARLDERLRYFLREAGKEVRTAPAGACPADGTVVRGSLDSIDAGSGVARFLVGFGAGQSKLRSTVRLYNGSVSDTTPAYELRVIGGSKGSSRGDYPSLADAEDAAEQIAVFIAAPK